MYKIQLCLVFCLYQSVFSQDLTFEDSSSNVQEGDVDSRLFSVNLGSIGLGGIGEAAIGTVIGNAATGFINECFGRRKRSIIMDRIYNKRSAQEQVTQEDVNGRLFCLNNNNNNGLSYRPNCLTCSCSRDRNCRNYCNKCSNNNFGGSYFSCNNCNCNSDTRCYNTCDKCYSSNSNNFGSVNCNTCSCRYNNCFNTCRKCVNNNYSFSSNNVNCNTCSCSYDQNCRNRCNCYSYGNNNWWNGVRARNEGEQERPDFIDQDSSNNNPGFSSSSGNQGSSSDAVIFA